MFNPIEASKEIRNELEDYLSTTFHIADKEYMEQFKQELKKEGVIAKGPFLDIGDSYETGRSLKELISTNDASELFETLEGTIPEGDKEIKIERLLYKHQEQALLKVNNGKNLVVTTGTGSGKTECFVIPIINNLLEEEKNGTLNDGVRAILIYPMNALANDQMKRLRETLKEHPQITFGVYNRNTKETEAEGISEYGKIFKDANGRPLKPLDNEVISRKKMRECPPHILVTNYAMLEYMLLRPNDDRVFTGAKLKFLVLDEAHIYKGATGIETSLLLRRLKARISEPENVINILTSATLGGKESDSDIVKFASTLCDANFDADDIVRSHPKAILYDGEEQEVPIEVFRELSNPTEAIEDIFNKFELAMEGSSEEEIFYNLCASSKIYKKLREVVSQPMTIDEIVTEMKNTYEVTDYDIVALIDVASKAQKNKTALIKARYHMFLRALEGAYITLNEEKKLSLKRNLFYQTDEECWKYFEMAICDDCGRIAIAGKTIHDRLEFVSNIRTDDAEVYMLMEDDEKFEEDEDDNFNLGDEAIEKNEYYICPVCGEIHHASLRHEFKCNHEVQNHKKVIRIVNSNNKGSFKCPICKYGNTRLVYTGYDAVTAVIGTSLFEKLPESELRVEIKQKKTASSLFGGGASSSKSVSVVKKERQFLAFSDSRSEAAYFASNMSNYYAEFLRRRGLWHVINENKSDIQCHPWEVKTLVEELTNYFDVNRSFAEVGDKGIENLHAESRRQAWIAVLNEMVNARRSTSLVSMGLMRFTYKRIDDELLQMFVDTFHQKLGDMKNLFNLLVMDIVYNGALEGEASLNLGDDNRKYIYYTIRPRRFKLVKDAELDKDKMHLSSWVPRLRSNGNYYNNSRVSRIVRSLGISEQEAVELLKDFWDHVLTQENGLSVEADNEYYFLTDKFQVNVGSDDEPLYQCAKCGRTTMFNDNGHCSSVKCSGKLIQINREEFWNSNHYANLYQTEKMSPLHIKEHTAQLGREEQQEYQELFVKKEINALSCSTTFEMGVDVGDLETVYLRNIPPSPANYVQRAGRAGRSLRSASYALTYAKLSSHDMTYFERPVDMIAGKIGVPLFSIENKKVILRHVFAVALSGFFAENPEIYNKNNADLFLNENGYELLKDYINSHPEDLLELLLKSIPTQMQDVLGINDFAWVNEMVGKDGILDIAVQDFRNTVEWYVKEIRKNRRNKEDQIANTLEKQLWEYRKGKDDKRGINELIEFLVRNNVLPKYGFPVDTVELHQNKSSTPKRLQMVRDLQLGVAEYAPGSHVVADGKMYTSRYVNKIPQTTGQSWETAYVAICGNPVCGTMNFSRKKPDEGGKACIACGMIIGKGKWKKTIEPRKGFVADENVEDVPMKKPERDYRGDDFYLGDIQRQVIDTRSYLIDEKEKIQIETSANDSLLVVCNDDFYVCGKCGWALNKKEALKNKSFDSRKALNKIKHKAAWGGNCEGSVSKTKLNHVFKTDVVKIAFGTRLAADQPTMLSVMYALLEATSRELEIERTDIKGTLFRKQYGRKMVYSVVLYDAVAGGAGQIRRLVSNDGANIQRVFERAIKITKECNCSPSCYNCLRNYYNSTYHDILNRKLAYEFLERYVGKMNVIPNEDYDDRKNKVNNDINSENLSIKFPDPYPTEGSSWDDIIGTYANPNDDNERRAIGELSEVLTLPDYTATDVCVQSFEDMVIGLFVWLDNKIIVLDECEEVFDHPEWYICKLDNLNIEEIKKWLNGGE